MSPLPRVARAPHSSKSPDACPYCGSHVLTRRGIRKKKLEIVQLYAHTNAPIAQLAIYALALTRLVPGLALFDIKCAWFNEQEYCEFYPRMLFAS